MAAKKKRMAGIELLRILAMLMVTMLHYLYKGNVLPDLTGSMTVNGYLAWGLELLSIVAVNSYMLISGFFLVDSRFRIRRLIRLLFQVLFYTVMIPVVLILCGVLKPAQITLYQLLQYFLPTQMGHYWFITAYVIMYLFSPLLSAAVKSMGKNQLRTVILLLLLFFSVGKSVLPVRLETDNMGNDGLWFLCVYLVAAYMRLYGMEECRKLGKKAFGGYFLSSAAMYALTMGLRLLYLKTGQFTTVLTTVCGYNHILNLLAALCLFVGFYHWEIQEGRLSGLILRIAPYTLGVYLLHEHVEVRYLWPAWLGADSACAPVLFVVKCIASVILVFLAGVLVDMARAALFGLIGRALSGSRIDRFMDRIDRLVGGLAEPKGQ